MGSWEGIEMGYVLDDQGNRTGEIVSRAEWANRQSAQSARLRTAHDQAALEGKVPFAMGGNPTPAERQRQAEHDAAQAARMRDAIPTLAEVMAADTWVTRPGGAVVPQRLNRDSGWGDDADRDSDAAAELARLVKVMDGLADDLLMGKVGHGVAAAKLASTWQAIRKITRENGGK